MDALVANRTWVKDACEELLNPGCQKRILFFSGESGIGKTTLLRHFRSKIPAGVYWVPIDFKENAISVGDIFYKLAKQVSWDKLPNLTAQIDYIWNSSDSVLSTSSVSLSNQNHSLLVNLRDLLFERFNNEELEDICFNLGIEYENLSGEGRKAKARELVTYLKRRGRISELLQAIQKLRPCLSIDVADYLPEKIHSGNWLGRMSAILRENGYSDQKYRLAALTEACFDDLQALGSNVFIAFDTYEHVSTEVEQWICDPFLEGVARVKNLCVLLVGQKVPDDHNIKWGHWCESRELLGVTDAEDWFDFMEESGRRIDKTEPLPFLETLCDALRGHPESIMKVIQGLPTG